MFDESEKHIIILKKLGAKIKHTRKIKGLKQNEVAFRCNFDKSSLNNIESGKRNITIITLFKISEALEVPLSYFLDITIDLNQKSNVH